MYKTPIYNIIKIPLKLTGFLSLFSNYIKYVFKGVFSQSPTENDKIQKYNKH